MAEDRKTTAEERECWRNEEEQRYQAQRQEEKRRYQEEWQEEEDRYQARRQKEKEDRYREEAQRRLQQKWQPMEKSIAENEEPGNQNPAPLDQKPTVVSSCSPDEQAAP